MKGIFVSKEDNVLSVNIFVYPPTHKHALKLLLERWYELGENGESAMPIPSADYLGASTMEIL